MFEPSPGDALFSLYPIAARRPYLRRNVRKVIRHLTMGSVLSNQKPSYEEDSQHERMASDDEGARPAKRQKLHHMLEHPQKNLDEGRQPLGQVMGGNGNARSRRSMEEIPPESFYGRKKKDNQALVSAARVESEKEVKRSTSSSLKAILPEEPHFFHQSLRVDNIEFLSTMDDEDIDVNLFEDQDLPFDIKCRCSAAIFYAKNDQKPGVVGINDFMEVSRLNQYCVLRISHRKDGNISRKLILPEPFVFKPENFFVNRKKRKEDGRFLSGKKYLNKFGFADKYNLHFFVDPLNYNKQWPPIAIDPSEHVSPDNGKRYSISRALQDGSLDRDDLHLFCGTGIFSDSRTLSTRRTVLHLGHRVTRQKVPYITQFRLDWTLPNLHTKVNIKPPKAEPQIKAHSESTALNPPRSPLHVQDQASILESPGDERLRRKRSNVPTYNLKQLTYGVVQPQGRSLRISNLQPSTSEHHNLDPATVSVQYRFHREQSSEVGKKYEANAIGLDCIFCGSRNVSLEDLRLHLRTDHSAFKFVMQRSELSITFNVEIIRQRRVTNSIPPEIQTVFEMRKPIPDFNLEDYLAGDDFWSVSRQKMEDKGYLERLPHGASSASSSEQGTRQSSPNTSADLEYLEKSSLKPAPKRKDFLVPQTPRPTYDSNTKQILKPGDKLPENDGECDEIWLHHRKHDLLSEFVDVPEDEKEYLRLWNLYLVDQHLTSDKYLAQTVAHFAETYKVWIMETKSHMEAFTTHMEALKLRGVFGNEDLDKCIWILKSGEKVSTKGKGREVDAPEELPTAKLRKFGHCICGERPLPGDATICRGTKCKARTFHQECAESTGRPTGIKDDWKCDDCFT